MLSSCWCSMMGVFLVSLHQKVSYSCSSTTVVSFPFGAMCRGGARSWRPWAVMQPRQQKRSQKRSRGFG